MNITSDPHSRGGSSSAVPAHSAPAVCSAARRCWHRQRGRQVEAQASDLLVVNGRIHTMDQDNRVVSQALIRNGRFTAVGNNVAARGGNVRRIDLQGKDGDPGPHRRAQPHRARREPARMAHAARARLHDPRRDRRAEGAQRAAFLPASSSRPSVRSRRCSSRNAGCRTLTELDAVGRPVYIQAAQGGARTNSQGKAWLEAKGVMVAADGAIAGPALATGASGAAQGTADARDEKAVGARRARVLREARRHDASRLRRVSLGRAVRRPRQREHLHDAQPVSRAASRAEDAGPAAD